MNELPGTVGADGKIRLCDLHPGDYRFTLRSAKDWYAVRTFTITDRDITGFSTAPTARIPIPGEVAFESVVPNPPLDAKIRVRVLPLNASISTVSTAKTITEVSMPGQFSLGPLEMDEMTVSVLGLPASVYVKDITYGNRSVLSQTFVPGSAVGNGTLRGVLALDGAYVNLTVADKDGNAIPDSPVVMMPASALGEAAPADRLVTGKTDQNGAWTSPPVAPGKYYVLAPEVAVDKSPESIGKLWRARVGAKEV